MNIHYGNICDTSNIESNSFLQLNSCGIQYPCKRDLISFRKTGRADYHIIYIIDGVCKVKYDNKSETLKKGGFILYPPNMPQLYKEYKDTKKIWLHFNGFSVDEIGSAEKVVQAISDNTRQGENYRYKLNIICQ